MKILIAEDDVHLQRAYRRVFHEHTLILENNPRDAIRQLVLDPDIELVISDYELIEGTGLDIYAWVATHRPALPFVVVSGYQGDLAFPAGVRRLRKPFDTDELKGLIR